MFVKIRYMLHPTLKILEKKKIFQKIKLDDFLQLIPLEINFQQSRHRSDGAIRLARNHDADTGD